MKRGALLVVLVLALATALAVTALIEAPPVWHDVGSSWVYATDNWTLDSHPGYLYLEDPQDPGWIHIIFLNETVRLRKGSCRTMRNYRVCYPQSLLAFNFDPEIKASPYQFKISASALSADLTMNLSRPPANFLAGEYAPYTLTLRNNGDWLANKTRAWFNARNLLVRNIKAPCYMDNGNLTWNGSIEPKKSGECSFELATRNTSDVTLLGKAKYDNGRFNVYNYTAKTGWQLKPAKDTVRIILPKGPTTLTTWVNASVIISNPSATTRGVNGTITTPYGEVRNSTFSASVPAGGNVTAEFGVLPYRTGNNSVTATVVWGMDDIDVTENDSVKINVSVPRMQVRAFGDLTIPLPGATPISVEATNDNEFPIVNATLSFLAPTIVIPSPKTSITMQPGRIEQFYLGPAMLNFSNSSEVVWLVLTYQTPFGETLTRIGNATFTVGKLVYGQKPRVSTPTPPKVTPPKPTTTPTTKPTSNVTRTPASSAKLPLADQGGVTMMLAFAIFGALVLGILWLFLQLGRRSGPKEEE